MERLITTLRHHFPAPKTWFHVLLMAGCSLIASGQITEDCLTGECTDHSIVVCSNETKTQLELLENSAGFQTDFQERFRTPYSLFADLNPYYIFTIHHIIAKRVCQEQFPEEQMQELLFSLVAQFEAELLFEEPPHPRPGVTSLGKDLFIPHHDEEDMWFTFKSRSDACLNTDFEEGDFSSWQTFCGNVDNTLGNIINITPYTPPAACPAPVNGAAQHSIATGGLDPNTGFPRVFPDGGGASAMIGDGVGSNSKASVLRKTFTVDATNTILTYSYMAVLEDPGAHTPGEKPFFRTRLYDENGISDPCAEYFAFGGDGQPGWIIAGGIQYRDWTTIFIPLDNYIGQDVTIEFATGDCSLSGHYGYAYVDASCSSLEIEQVCEGTSTVLIAPDGGASYLWSTGETSQQITVTAPGTYTCEVVPVGSTCSVLMDIDVVLFPVPTADFALNSAIICEGGEVEITDNSTVDPGGVISSYQWTFGDGITTPASTGTITGVPQTTGTYTSLEHVYTTQGNPTIELEIITADGCVDTHTVPLTVTVPPTASIATDAVVCQGGISPLVTFTGAGTAGPFTFTFNVNGGPDQFITTTGGSATVNLAVPTGTAGTYLYNLLHVSDPGSSTCSQDQTGAATIVVNPLSTAQITGDAVVCESEAQPSITFTGSDGTAEYEFTYTINGGAPQTVATSGSSAVMIAVPTGTAGTYVYDLVSVTDLATGCSQSQVGSASVTVNPLPAAQIGADATVCQNDAQPSVTFTGANGTSDYVFYYTINGGGVLSAATVGSNTVSVPVSTTAAGTYVYDLVSVEDLSTGCSQSQTGSATIVVNPQPTATIGGTVTVCQFSPDPLVTFSGLNGTSDYSFTYTLNGSAPQTIATSGASTVDLPVSTAVSGVYTYQLLSVTDLSTGCSQVQGGLATVTVNPMPTATIAGDVTLCQDSNEPVITFTGVNSSSEYTFGYTLNGGSVQYLTTSGAATIAIPAPTDVPGTFVYDLVDVTDPATGCGQPQTGSATVVIQQLPAAVISPAVEACHNDVQLSEVELQGVGGTAPYTFTYTVNGGGPQVAVSPGGSNTVTLTHPTGTVGTFTYTITHIQEGSALGCAQDQSVSTSVTIHSLPVVVAGNDFSVCAGENIVLTGSGAVSYTWDNGAVDGIPFPVFDTTTFTVTGTDANGCQNTDQLTVNVVPIPVMDFEGQNIYGCAPLNATFINHSSGNLVDCQWIFGNGEVASGCGTVSAMFEVPGCYDVTLIVSTPEGCSNSLTISDFVCALETPDADFYPDPAELTTYDWESQMVNESDGATQYEWNFGDGSPLSAEFSPTHAFPNDFGDTYQVMLVAWNDAGCVDTAYAQINLTEELLVYVPNTFTPDGDLHNDSFRPVFETGYDPYNYSMWIYNRWGEIVFETHDVEIGWSGLYGMDGNNCQDGTYTWKIQVKRRDSNKVVELLGHVNLLR